MSFLKRALTANGMFSAAVGLAVAVFSSALANYLAVPILLLGVIGVGTALFGLVVLWQVRTGNLAHGFALAVIGADLLWVVAAAVVLALPGSMDHKWLLAGVSIPVAFFAAAQSKGLLVASRQSPRLLRTSVEVEAPVSVVWDSLTDFDSYETWNPFITTASGPLEVGRTLKLRMQPAGGRAMTIKPEVTGVEPSAGYEWLGSLGIPGLFEGRHRFELTDFGPRTQLIQSEEFSGLLVPLLWKSLNSGTRAGFESMNHALKNRVEGSVPDSM